MGEKLIWGGSDIFTHMLIVGPTRCGKTATLLKPIIYNILLQKKRGKPVGLTVVEPKGDMAFMVREMCEAMEIDYIHIDPAPADKRSYAEEAGYDPSYKSHRFNPMQGDEDTVAEATVAVLQSLFGKQESFFKTVQEVSARNVTKLLKRLYGDRIDVTDIINVLRDPMLMEKKVKELVQREGHSDLTRFFEAELLGSLRDEYRRFAIGLRAQLENLTANESLKRIITGESSINIDEHFEKGGVLAVNTALGELGTSGDAFGQFVIMHLQAGTFRRKGTERTRVPHFLIVDELSRYINPDLERFLNIAAEYRVAGIFATQSLGQLEVESGKLSAKAVKRAIMTGCRNKIAFGGLSAEDAKEFAEEFGKKQIIERQATYETKIIGANLFPSNYRDTEKEEYRFFYTQLIDGLPRFHFVYKLLKDGTPQPPGIGKGTFVPKDWKERREWEQEPPKKAGFFDFLKSPFKRRFERGDAKEPIPDERDVPVEQNSEETKQHYLQTDKHDGALKGNDALKGGDAGEEPTNVQPVVAENTGDKADEEKEAVSSQSDSGRKQDGTSKKDDFWF